MSRTTGCIMKNSNYLMKTRWNINVNNSISIISYRSYTNEKKKKVAVVLSGCGVQDGSEIHEATSMLIHLSRHGTETTCFAPDAFFPAINHATDEPEKEERNAMAEAARISRGQIRDLCELDELHFDAVLIPGGFGAAKLLSTFAKDGDKMQVRDDVEKVIKNFNEARKPIGMCCIAPVMAAKVIPGCQVTIGKDPEIAKAIQAMGSTHIEKDVNGIHYDEKNNLITTPAYMLGDPVHKVYDGIGKLVEKVLTLI